MESNVFIVIDKFGELFIKDVFVTFDYPRVFSCTNKFNCKFLFYSYDFDDDFDEWVVVQMTNGKYYKLITNQISLRDSIINAEGKTYLVNRNYANGSIDVNIIEKNIQDYVTEYETFVGEKVDKSIDTHDIMSESNIIGMPLIDIVLYPNNHEVKDVDANVLDKIFSSTRKWVSCITGNNNARVSMPQGSFVIRFNLNTKNNLFIDEENEKSIETINQILTLDDPVKIYEELNFNATAMNSYNSVLKNLGRLNDSIRVISSQPTHEMPRIVEISQENVKSLQNRISNFVKEKIKTINVLGKLLAFDTLARKYIICSDNINYKGEFVDDLLKMDLKFVIDDYYNCTIEVIEEQVNGLEYNSKKSKKYILSNIEKCEQ